MPHVMFGGLVHEQALTLARRLAALLPGDLDRVFFSESGSVAVEIAMKMAQQYWINRGEPNKTKFVAFKGGYHGDTTGAMAVSDPDAGMHDVFRGLLPEHVIIDLPADAASCGCARTGPGAARRAHRRADRRAAGAGGWRACVSTTPPRCNGCAPSRTAAAPCSFSTKSSPALAAPARCSPASRLASFPTSSRCPRR